MSDKEAGKAVEVLEQIDDVLRRAERVSRLQISIIVMTAAAVLWGARLEFRVNDLYEQNDRHEVQTRRLEDRQDDLRQRMSRIEASTAGVSQNVNVNTSQAPDEDETALMARRDYVTVQDVAEMAGVSERTVIEWIDLGRIQPMPEKTGKSWVIADNFRIMPQVAEKR